MNTSTKLCRKCGQVKPIFEFHVRKNRKSGVQSECKACSYRQQKQWRKRNPDKLSAQSKRYRAHNYEKVRERERLYSNTHKEQAKDRGKRWIEANPDRQRERTRRYDLTHPEQAKQRQARYRDSHREVMRDKSRRRYRLDAACQVQRVRVYQRSNREKVAIIAQRRRARLRNLPNTFTSGDWSQSLKYWSNRCAYCDRPAGLWHKLAQDHFVPVALGGGYTSDNILPACHGIDGCNNSKHNSDPHEWIAVHFGERKGAQIEKRIAKYFKWASEQDH